MILETEIKSSVVEHPVLPLIEKRHSTRAFSDKEVTPTQIESLFEAARWAPSAGNQQPWKYIYATKQQPELYNKIASCLMEGNKTWAANAPLLVISLAKNVMANGKPYHHALYDTGSANQNLMLQAESMGLHTHAMGGFDKDKTRETFALPAELDPVVFIAIGYKGDIQSLPEALRVRENITDRFRQEQFIINPQ